MANSKVGPKKISPSAYCFSRKLLGAVLHSPPYTVYILPFSKAFEGIKKWFTDPFFRYCYPHKELLRVLSLGSKSNFFWYFSSRCYRFLVETNISWGKYHLSSQNRSHHLLQYFLILMKEKKSLLRIPAAFLVLSFWPG